LTYLTFGSLNATSVALFLKKSSNGSIAHFSLPHFKKLIIPIGPGPIFKILQSFLSIDEIYGAIFFQIPLLSNRTSLIVS